MESSLWRLVQRQTSMWRRWVCVVLCTAEGYVKFDNYIYLHSYRCKMYLSDWSDHFMHFWHEGVFPTTGPLSSVCWDFNWMHHWRIISVFVVLMKAARTEQQLHSCSHFVALVNISCFPVQAFLTLARDIKAKMDKKLVSTNLFRSVWDTRCRISSAFVVLGGQQPPGQQSRSEDYGAAQEEQFLPLHSPVRRREQRHPPLP